MLKKASLALRDPKAILPLAILAAVFAFNTSAIVLDTSLLALLHAAQAEHADQQVFYDLVATGQGAQAFELSFDEGDELFEVSFNALDGVGANVGEGQRFTRIPRADLAAGTEWANHFPARATGPNAQGAFESDSSGKAVVRLYGDLKRHDMGPGLAENIDETGSGSSTWMTKELWGVGSTPPYLHDGRATTLTEAILEHGGEGADSRQRFENLSTNRQARLIAFLENLVLFKIEEEG